MTRVRFILLAAGSSLLFALPVQAQHQGHNMPGMTMPAKKPTVRKKPAAKKHVARKAAAKKKAAPAKKAVKKAVLAKPKPSPPIDPHAGHDMSQMPATTAAPTVDPHAGHDMSAVAVPAGTDLPAGTSAPPPIPTDHAADAVYGAGAMAMGRHHLDTMHGAQKFSKVMLDIAEYQARKGRDGFEWDGEAWYGGDIDRLWIKSEGEISGAVEKAEVQALYNRAVGPYFNLQGGIRYDFKPSPSRAYAVIGFEGLAPRFFEVEGALFLSTKGELFARAEGHYDQRITQRLIIQPRAEVNFAAQSQRATMTGAGLSDAELGFRLRYDIKREFAPYIGVQYHRAFGRTRDYRRDAGEDSSALSLLAGVRLWL